MWSKDSSISIDYLGPSNKIQVIEGNGGKLFSFSTSNSPEYIFYSES